MPVSPPQKPLGLPPAFIPVKIAVLFVIVEYLDGLEGAPDSLNERTFIRGSKY